MIPQAYITEWRQVAPWSDDSYVEQDLILSRAIIEIFSHPLLKRELAFRGGTALHKLFFTPSARYSEDIDLVRTSKGPITPIVNALRECCDPWLGEPKTKRTKHSFKLLYFFYPENMPASKLRIKIEINIVESFSILDRFEKDFSVASRWFSGTARVNTFQLEELLATKLRALYQRRKGRDVFDLWMALTRLNLDIEKVVEVFCEYLKRDNKIITRELFEKNLTSKIQEQAFLDDIQLLLSPTLMDTQAKSIIFPGDIILTSEDGTIVTSEGWHLTDAANKIKDVFLTLFPT